ncbi:helix-turn-helix domain-containing protein [Niabella drilacis]|uniref:AraC-type DNA-binding protein n=1 Tax=Niabella drilacis (strain DSM 25811 / CCM 8410 / CCUG 62505 / LMG 26954 / E90) TaxID=1285928 RepID=A0A1G6WY74_NIADE|nr:helix-turn-helix domain-containing protein [Niabella drilacis]SDD70848.1 AraC-type DNA-binding protein [Niabella drilacis]
MQQLQKMIKTYNIPAFLKYLNINASNSDTIQVVFYDEHPEKLLKSIPVKIDFYLLALKDKIEVQSPVEEMSDSYLFLDKPGNTIEWDLKEPFEGFAILISEKLLNKAVKDVSFADYNRHEALFLTKEEKETLYDLFRKAFAEFQKKNSATEVLVSYTSLILSYTQIYYERQFEARSNVYNRVVADFYKQLDNYLNEPNEKSGLPSVAYFAGQANLSTNYFGDLIKHFTGKAPIDHIHEGIIQIAKSRLLKTKLSVGEIAYSLGFDYPTYFTRFFRQKTGISPKVFRNQS